MGKLEVSSGITGFKRRALLWLVLAALASSEMTSLATPAFARVITTRTARRHHVVILIDSDDDKVMGHAISYSLSLARAYAEKHETVQIEIVANGSGIKLFRDDTSSLQQPLAALRRMMPDIVFSMCDASRQLAQEREGHPINPIQGARLVPFGIGRIAELQETGWAYIHG